MRYLALEGERMDAAVFSIGKGLWHVNTSPTMRDLGEIIRSADGTFTLVPDEGAALEGMAVGPYPSLDKARDAIAAHLGGKCSLARSRSFF